MAVNNALTVDVEDYYHVCAFERHIARADWGRYESRVVANTRRILRLLRHYRVRGTFFVLGWVAEQYPYLVQEIQAAGHEVGSHGYWHQPLYRLSPEEFRADLVRSKKVLEDILGTAVTCYRAPRFSITRKSSWALAILAQEGFRFDSSIFPMDRDRASVPNVKATIQALDTPYGRLWEFPVSIVRLGFMNLPVSGGGYFRLYPVSWTLRLLSRINRTHGRPFLFYIHPWEVDTEQPRLAAGSAMGRLRHYVNLKSTERKLMRLLKSFAFGPMTEVIEKAGEI